MPLEADKVRNQLQAFDFNTLFTDSLGWQQPRNLPRETLTVDAMTAQITPVAELAGVVALEITAADGAIPGPEIRRAIHHKIAERHHENLIVFVNRERSQSLWRWEKRDGKKTFPREHHYFRGQPGDLFLAKISGMQVDIAELDEDGNIALVAARDKLRAALDIERVTKKFYEAFKDQRIAFTELIKGIESEKDRKWYASVLLNRLMFIWFLQAKGFLDDGDRLYLKTRLDDAPLRYGHDGYYREFLRPLFFNAFALPEEQRDSDTRERVGDIPYLNGTLFLPHAIEDRNPDIRVPDAAFANMYALFGKFSWSLNDRIGGDDDTIDPDVLGYIFEKYINQKAFGAYYTRPEITDYLCEQTIQRVILDKVNPVVNLTNPAAWPDGVPARAYDSLPELLLNLTPELARLLLKQTLPQLSLLDPACGSGAFLVAAMKTMMNVYGAIVGWIRTHHDSELSGLLQTWEAEHRSLEYYLKRKIITENLYGVDIMPESIEIARLRLYIALVSSAQEKSQLEPLPNIDFNLMAGNSLIGLRRVTDAISSKKPEQRTLFDGQYAEIVAETNRKVKLYRDSREFRANLHDLRDEIAVLKKTTCGELNRILLDEFGALGIKFEAAAWDAAKNAEGKPTKRALTVKDMEDLEPFHWGYEFDEVLNGRGGFDAIITNPPWEVFQTSDKEFFREYDKLITAKKMRIEDLMERKEELLKDDEIRAAWLAYMSRFPHVSAYLKSAKQYENQLSVVNGKKAASKINLYSYFTEQCYNLLKPGAQCGIVLPSGLYTDLGTKQLREMLFANAEISGLFCFENSKAIFEGVHRSFKFIVLTFGKGGHTVTFPAAFMRHEVAELALFPRHGALPISVELVRRLSPDSLSVMEFKTPLDVTIAEKMLRFPLLGERRTDTWNLVLTQEFNMTSDSKLFKTSPAFSRLPLYEGKVIHQFTHEWGKPKYWIDEKEARKAIAGREGDKGQILNYQRYRIGYREIAASTNERTLICTILPQGVFANHKLHLSRNEMPADVMLYICAVLNSFVFDTMIRQRVSTGITMSVFYQLAMPRLMQNDAGFRPLVERAARLVCTTPEFDELAREIGLTAHPHPPAPLPDSRTSSQGEGSHSATFSPLPVSEANASGRGAGGEGAPPARYGAVAPDERARLRAEIDARVALLYGLTEAEFRHILASFPLVPEGVRGAALSAYCALEAATPSPHADPLAANTAALMEAGESETVEFKRTLEYVDEAEMQAGGKPLSARPDVMKAVLHSSLKTIAAFLNGAGGTLLLGVHDSGHAVGLAPDLSLLKKPTPDAFELRLRDIIAKRFAPHPLGAITVRFPVVAGQRVCRVDVEPDGAIYHLDEKIYVRDGNRTIELTGAALTHWIQTRG